MEVFLGEKSGIQRPLPSKLSSYLSSKGFDLKGTFFLHFKFGVICSWFHVCISICIYVKAIET